MSSSRRAGYTTPSTPPTGIERHKRVAGDDSALLLATATPSATAPTATTEGCAPLKVHPNDWISMHPSAARQDNPRCMSCHQEQSFCRSATSAPGSR